VRCDGLSTDYPEFYEFACPTRWQVVAGGPELGGEDVVNVFVGGGAAWDTISEFTNFLRTLMNEQQIAPLLGAWLPGGEEASACSGSGGCSGGCATTPQLKFPTPLDERPLAEMSPLNASPLVEVLHNKRIDTWFQPVFYSGSHELWGHECLMRAKAADGSIISPAQLLDWARQEQLIFMLDRICRETHIANAAAALPGDSSVLINFLPTAIYEPTFCLRTTRAAAKRAGLDASRVIFEVVESEQVSDMEHLRHILDYYREAGFRTALDDVGAGYAGLTMLAELSPDLIKIDRELVRQAAGSKMHRIICNALSQIARQSGKLCLAEGIETAEEYEVMHSIGVDLVQGYYFGKPAADPAFTTNIAPIAADQGRRAIKKPAA